MARGDTTDLSAWPSLGLEGNLIAPAMVARIDRREAQEQTEDSYGVRKGLTIREEISLAFRVGQAHYCAFDKLQSPSVEATRRFTSAFLEETFAFSDLRDASSGAIACIAGDRVPVVVVPPSESLDRRSPTLSNHRSRSPAFALQDYLNDHEEALWGLVGNGTQLRLLRDNASLTRHAHIEADLSQIFANEDVASFSALWLIIHRSRFGAVGTPVSDCALERWRETGAREGEAARDRLAGQVKVALRVLGSAFLGANPGLAAQLQSGELPLSTWFNELLRLVYRLIFLMVAEDRNLLHPTNARTSARKLYGEGYSLTALRSQCMRRETWDRHHDRYEGMKVVFRALATGEDALALPALGGLFSIDELPHLGSAHLRNSAFMEAVYRLSWLSDQSSIVPVNWRAMQTEELGSVYETLLELQPQLADNGRTLIFATDISEKKGNQRKTTGSYYTPDSLVQSLLDTALDPVLNRTEAEAEDPAKALLELAIIDPACGSGHFLLAATRRIATRLARIRSEGIPSLVDFRHALRDVSRCCIYGVDRNPMAVELAKVALWIETIDPGLPLTFFDAQIRCGDSLLGVFDLSVLEEGIPDAAYKPLTGDDKDTAGYYLRTNRDSKAGQGEFDFGAGQGAMPPMKPLVAGFSGLRDLPEDTVEQVGAKSARYTDLRTKHGFAHASAAADLYVAAFLAPKTGGPPAGASARTVPTSKEVWIAMADGTIRQSMMGACQIVRQARAFHWPLEFPDIMARGGFDVVLGNPPWERIKLQEKEFFAAKAPEITKAGKAADRKEMIGELEMSDPMLFSEWNRALRVAATASHFIRESGRFPWGGVGDVNTYAVFSDLCLNAINSMGRAGLIVQNGLVTGFTYRKFLRHLLTSRALASFYGFENEGKIFKDIHNEIKFGLLTITGKADPVDQPWFTAHLRQPTEIYDPARRYRLSANEIKAINPNTLNLPAFRWARDADVTAAIHKAAPALIRKNTEEKEQNPWHISFKRMFDMANSSEHFIDNQDIEALIIRRQGALVTLKDGRKFYPLYEGKMCWHFDHRYGTYKGQTQKQANKGVLPRVPDTRHDDPNYRIEPRYWVDAARTSEALGEESTRGWFFAWRDVGPSERTFVGTVIPKTAAGHTAPVLVSRCEPLLFSALVGCLGSLVVDYTARQRGNRMMFFVLEQAPVILPETLRLELPWMGTSASKWISERVLELSYTSLELYKFAKELRREHSPFRWLPERRIVLQAEIDAAILHLYKLKRAQAEWLIDSFTVLRKYEERDHGEFRTKRLVLEIFDEIEAANQAGRVFRTRLDPEPADPSLCHPASPMVES